MPMRVLGVAIAFVLVIVACGGGGGEGTPPGVTPITVHGRVLVRQSDSRLRPPAIGVGVVIEGHPQVLTDGAGEFFVDDVTPPYTAIVLDHGFAGASVYVGLTRSDPVLFGPLAGASAPEVSSAEGTVTGGTGWPTPPGHETVVTFGNMARGPIAITAADATTGDYGVTLRWIGGSPITITGSAFQLSRDGTGVPTGYTGFGTAAIDASHGVPATGVDIALGPVTSAAATGTIAIPSGYDPAQTLLEASLDAGPAFSIWMGTHTSGPISLLTPNLPATTIRLILSSAAPTGEDSVIGRVIQPGDSDLSMQIPEVVQLLDPPDGVTGVTESTIFEVNEHPNRAYVVRYRPSPPSDGPYLFLTTSESSWTVPDLTAYGITIPAASTYEWRAEGLGPATVDDLCDEVPFKSRTYFESTYASYIEFTTAP